MSGNHESCQLSITEIAAILSLAGRKSMVGFRTQDALQLTGEKMWDACCTLMKDGMMTQIDGKFRLCRELVEVMQPVSQARMALVLTPGSDEQAQIVFYCADRVAAMMPAVFGGYLMTAMEAGEVAGEIAEHLSLSFPEQQPTDGDLSPNITVQPDDTRENLLQDAVAVLELLDAKTGKRTSWIRIAEQGLFSWLQWTDRGKIRCEIMTQEKLEEILNLMLRGEL